MPLFDTKNITKQHLQELIDNKIFENKELEFPKTMRTSITLWNRNDYRNVAVINFNGYTFHTM